MSCAQGFSRPIRSHPEMHPAESHNNSCNTLSHYPRSAVALKEIEDSFRFPTVQRCTHATACSSWSRFGLQAIKFSTPGSLHLLSPASPPLSPSSAFDCTKLIAAHVHQSHTPTCSVRAAVLWGYKSNRSPRFTPLSLAPHTSLRSRTGRPSGSRHSVSQVPASSSGSESSCSTYALTHCTCGALCSTSKPAIAALSTVLLAACSFGHAPMLHRTRHTGITQLTVPQQGDRA